MSIEITMPALSPTMTEGTLSKWVKKEGDEISSGDVIAEIETDKATMEVESIDDGILGKIFVAEGTEGVAVNSIIGLLLEDGEDKSVADNYKLPEAVVEAAEEVTEEAESAGDTPKKAAPKAAAGVAIVATSAPIPPAGAKKTGGKPASPLAKKIASDNGVNIAAVVGTGPNGRVTKSDVEKYMKYGAGAGLVSRDTTEFSTEPNNGMRKVVAKRLTESKQQVPHFYLSVDCQLDDLLKIRAQLNSKANGAYKISVNDFIIKASAMAMVDVPAANTSWYDDATVHYNNIDISVAVAVDGGLLTPIVANADQKSLAQISNEMKSLAGRARKGELLPEEYTGGGFSISNLGMYGVKNFNAIINPPQSCILAVGAGEKRPVVIGDALDIATVMTVTLSVDHRTVDGAVGAEFLAAFKQYIEAPALLIA